MALATNIDERLWHMDVRTGDRVEVEFEKVQPDLRLFKGSRYARVLFDDGHWTEGPCYSRLWRTVLFSDIPTDRVLRFNEETGVVDTFLRDAGHHNGHTLDREGRLYACSQAGRSVLRHNHDGSVDILASEFAGKPLNSPNDVVVKRDGTVWFTDPTYGITSSYEGVRRPVEQQHRNVFRIDRDGTLHSVLSSLEAPNGLAFSADESALYVADSSTWELWKYPVVNNELGDGRRLVVSDVGPYDGLRLDEEGRVWGATPEGLHCLSPEGELLGRMKTPVVCSNFCFGGPRGNILYITARSYLLSVMTGVRGLEFAVSR